MTANISTLEQLKALDLKTADPNYIWELVNQIGALPIMRSEYAKGKIFERALSNRDGEPDFYQVSRMSFKPAHLNTNYQRASTPENTMFYGSVLKDQYTHDDVAYARITACCEVSDLLRDNTILEGERIMTLGTWRLKNYITCATIFDPSKTYTIDFLNEVKDAYIAKLESAPKELREKGYAYLEFLASEFSKDVKKDQNHEYHISSQFSRVVSITGVDGIVYPSVRSAGLNLCIALHPRLMNELELIMVNKVHVIKKYGKVSIRYIGRCNVPENATEFKLLTMQEFKDSFGSL